MNWQSQIIELLTASLIRPVALAAAAWLILRIYKVRHPASRHAVWTAVLIGMMVLPIVSVFAPQWKLPLLPKKPEAVAQTQVQQSDDFIDVQPNTVASTPQPAVKFAWPAPQTLLVWCYFAGVLAMVIFRLTGWALLWRVMSRSRALRTRLFESSEVITPVTVGVLRPSVILPAGWRNWNANTKRAVLAHEFAHIRRRDTLTSSLTRFAKCIYWFHPLAWWISRQMSELAELSCDAAALEKTRDPGSYSRILLGFAETVNIAGYRTALPGLAIASRSGMSHRIDQVFELASGNMRRLSRPGIMLAVMGLPVMCIAAVVGLTSPESVSQPHAATKPARQREQTGPRATLITTPKTPVQVVQLQAPPALTTAPKSLPLPAPEFDAISIRPTTFEGGGRGGPPGGGPLRFTQGRVVNSSSYGVTAARVILDAYRLTPYQLSGGPAWLESDRFDVEATAGDSSANESELRLMLQTMLAKRFKLVLRHGTREIPVYALVVGKGGLGPLLKEQKEEGDRVKTAGRVHAGQNRMMNAGTIRDLAERMTALGTVDRPVLDKTGLKGVYSWAILWDPDENFITAAQDELGLKFESEKAAVETLVVEQIEKPGAN